MLVAEKNSQCQQYSKVQKTYYYYQPVLETIIQLSHQPYGLVPPPSHPMQIEIYRTIQQPYADEFSEMTQEIRGDSTMGGRNEQEYLIIRNTNVRNISSMCIHRRVAGA